MLSQPSPRGLDQASQSALVDQRCTVSGLASIGGAGSVGSAVPHHAGSHRSGGNSRESPKRNLRNPSCSNGNPISVPVMVLVTPPRWIPVGCPLPRSSRPVSWQILVERGDSPTEGSARKATRPNTSSKRSLSLVIRIITSSATLIVLNWTQPSLDTDLPTVSYRSPRRAALLGSHSVTEQNTDAALFQEATRGVVAEHRRQCEEEEGRCDGQESAQCPVGT